MRIWINTKIVKLIFEDGYSYKVDADINVPFGTYEDPPNAPDPLKEVVHNEVKDGRGWAMLNTHGIVDTVEVRKYQPLEL